MAEKSVQEMQNCSHGAGPAADGAPFVAVAGVVEAEQLDDAELESAEVVLSQIGAEGRDSTCFLSVFPCSFKIKLGWKGVAKVLVESVEYTG